jgi:hypothetical protein
MQPQVVASERGQQDREALLSKQNVPQNDVIAALSLLMISNVTSFVDPVLSESVCAVQLLSLLRDCQPMNLPASLLVPSHSVGEG